MHYTPISYCLSLQLECIFPSHRYQSQCHRRLPNLNVLHFERHWMSSLDINVSLKPEAIKIPKLWVFLIVILLLGGCSTWISTRSCGMKKQSVQYTSHFSIHSMQAMAICSQNGSRCLIKGTWKLALLMCIINASLRCVDTFCWHLTSTEKMHGMFQFHNFSLMW